MIAAYNKATEGEPTSARETIAKQLSTWRPRVNATPTSCAKVRLLGPSVGVGLDRVLDELRIAFDSRKVLRESIQLQFVQFEREWLRNHV